MGVAQTSLTQWSSLTLPVMTYWLRQYTAAAAKSLQLCPTLCDPTDGSLLGSAVPGILQARTLEWVAISFPNAWKWKVKVKLLSRVRLLATPWLQPTRLLPPWEFPGKSTGVGCHCLLRQYTEKGTTSVLFLLKIHYLNLIMRKHYTNPNSDSLHNNWSAFFKGVKGQDWQKLRRLHTEPWQLKVTES